MNPYNQQYPYNFPQHTPGPPQPQWQAPPRRGWGDPRPSGHQQQPSGAQSPVSPFQSTASSGYYQPPPAQFPGTYAGPPPPPPLLGYGGPGYEHRPFPPRRGTYDGLQPLPPVGSATGPLIRPPVESASGPVQVLQNQYDTSSWGVKYNQSPQYQPQEEQRPPLPPRPTSATSNPSPTAQPVGAASQYQQGYGAAPAQLQQHDQWADYHYNQGQPQHQAHSSDIPPPPPPRPPQYQNQQQGQYQQPLVPHEHYSQQPPTHHYDPASQYTATRPQQQPSHQYNASVASLPPQPSADTIPVSPIEQGDTSLFYSSALGTGGPSDWEHFGGPSPGMSPEATSPPPRMEATASPGFDRPMQAMPKPASAASVQPAASSTFHSPAPTYATPVPTQIKDDTPAIQHRDSDSSFFIPDGIKRTGTIDSVIQVWSTPTTEASTAPPPLARGGAQDATPAPVRERIVEVEKVVEKIIDPYDDLEPEVKASLKRYVSMLRKESAAQTDEEKFAIFESHISKELRVRSMIYGVEPKLQLVKVGTMAIGVNEPAKDAALQRTTAAVDMGPPPQQTSNMESVDSEAAPETASIPIVTAALAQASPHLQHLIELPKATQPDQVKVQPVASSTEPSSEFEEPRSTISTTMQIPTNQVSPQSRDDFVMVNAGENELEYSPGGRPRVKQNAINDEPEYSPGGRPRVSKPSQIVTNTLNSAQSPAPEQQPSQISPGANAPMVLEDYVMAGPPSPGANAPMVVEPASATDLPQLVTPSSAPFVRAGSGQSTASRPYATPVKFEPARPAYTPFKYNTNVEAPKLTPEQSYSSLRKEGADSGRLMAHESSLPVGFDAPSNRPSTPSQRVHDEAFIGLIRQQSKAVRKKTPGVPVAGPIAALRPGTPARSLTPSQNPAPSPLKGNDLIGMTAALRQLLPDSVPDSYGMSQHAKVNSVKAAIDTVPDSFGFIKDTVMAWDHKNREVRKKQDDERSARQADSEQHIDELFNDNEIGYADIGDLEAEYKLDEAERKYQEDQLELESFTQGVYMPVNERLQRDLAELNSQYTIVVDLLDLESESASGMLKSSSSKAEMAFVMSCLLSVFNKLEIRYQKIAEANVERERRRKRLELTVLYTNGDTARVKSLEAEFAVAEKMQVLHEARGKDTRANKLMDTFDRATVRGLGDNQTYVDDLLALIRELRELILRNAQQIPESVYETDGPRDSLSLAQKAIEFVLADSQKLLTISNVADKILNDADFAVSVAEAKVSNADASTYEKLALEKEKEDQKIAEDTNTRMASIAKGPEEASALIREVVDRVGDDPMHKDRMKAALEAAKRRNAEKEGADMVDAGG